MLLIHHIAQLAGVSRSRQRAKRGPDLRDPALTENAAVLSDGETIRWVGPADQLPELPPGTAVIDAAGKAVVPGFIDSHTHLIYAGSRVDEFEQRLHGQSYQEIAAQGGGINATV